MHDGPVDVLLPATQSGAEREAIEVLRRLHGQLDQAVQHAEAVFEKLPLSETWSPQRADLVVVFEQTKAITTALADFLDGLDRELANEGSEPAQARLSADQVRGFLLEVEPPPQDGGQGSFHPGASRRTSALGRLPSFYGYHVGLDNGLYQRRVPRSYAWRQSVDLWQTLTYLGGTHAAGGLLSRLDRISKIQEARRAPRSPAGGAVVTQTAGQHVLTLGAVPPVQYYPWDRADIAALRRLAGRADFLATGADEAILEEARPAWCQIIDGWLEAGAGLGAADDSTIARMTDIIGRLIDEAPAADATITERLKKAAALDYLGEDARRKARAKLR
jgi:hypothetical protein